MPGGWCNSLTDTPQFHKSPRLFHIFQQLLALGDVALEANHLIT